MTEVSAWQVILLLIAIYNIGIGWLVNRIFKMLDDLRKEDTLIRAHITNGYVRRDDYIQFQDRLLSMLGRIEEKIDNKADKDGQ